MKILLPRFEVKGTSSYPDFYKLFVGLEKITFNGTDYFLTDYSGELELETGPDNYASYSAWLAEQPVITGIRKITIGSFRRRFTLAEKVAIEDSTDSTVKVLDKDLMTSSFIDLDFSETLDGMSYLVAVGVLTEERKNAMLVDGTPEEEYKGV